MSLILLSVLQDLPTEVTRGSTKALLDATARPHASWFVPCNKPKSKRTNNVSGSYARILQRFITNTYTDEHRQLLDLPPATLNGYLETFFRTIRRPGGRNYTWATFRTLMSHLDSYFKENNYPVVLSKAPELIGSRNAFHERRMRIRVCDTSADALQKLHDWMNCNMTRSSRHVKKIDLLSHHELDSLLAEFLTFVGSSWTESDTANYLLSLVVDIDNYLRGKEYPNTISDPNLFPKSWHVVRSYE